MAIADISVSSVFSVVTFEKPYVRRLECYRKQASHEALHSRQVIGQPAFFTLLRPLSSDLG